MRLKLLVVFTAVVSHAAQAEEELQVRLADCEMMQRHIEMLRASEWPLCRSVNTPFLSTIASRSEGHDACAVGDLEDPALQGFSCWVTPNIETSTLSCMRLMDYGTINTVQSGWKAASPIFVDGLRSAKRCPVSNGDSGFAILTNQGDFLDQFARPEFGFVVNFGDSLSTLERAVQSFGTGDPLLPWTQSEISHGFEQIGVETYAITACREGTSCDPAAYDPSLDAAGWRHEQLGFQIQAGPDGLGSFALSFSEVSFRKAWTTTPGLSIRPSCGIGSWTEPCAPLEEGTLFKEIFENRLGRRGFQNLAEVIPPAEYDDFINQLALQLPDQIATGTSGFVVPYAIRHLANIDGGFIPQFIDKFAIGEASIFVQKLTECSGGGMAIVYAIPDTRSDGRQAMFSTLIMAVFASSCPVAQAAVLARSINENVSEAIEGLRK